MALKLTDIIDILYIIWFIIRVNNLTGVKVFPLSPRQLPNTFRYIDDVSVSNNPNFANWILFIYMYLQALETKETASTSSSASFLDIYL